MLLIAGLLGVSMLSAQDQQVRINEIVAVNETGLADADGDHPDWIELFNAGPEAVNLAGWSLTDDPAEPKKWIFPDTVLGSGSFMVVFASGKNRYTPGGEMHTGFRLDGDGEYLALMGFLGDTVTRFYPAFPEMTADVSYGAYQDTYVQFTLPTPGAPNNAASLVLPPPLITVPHGLFDQDFQVELVSPLEDVEIYYTTDGSLPASDAGNYYNGPLTISGTTVLRAVTSRDDTHYSKVSTATYIFPGDVVSQPNDPEGYPAEWGPYTAISGTAVADYEMDPELMADSAHAAEVVEGLKSIPTMSLVTDPGYLFSHSTDPETGGIYIYTGPPLSPTDDGLGKGWERPVSVEYFNAEGQESFQVDCGLRLQGGHSRRPEKSPKHSFRLVFRDEYGPTRLDFPLFGEDGAATSFNTLILRAGFGLSWIHHEHEERRKGQYQRDIWAKDTQRELGHPSSRSEYVHLYINGIYWGIYAPSERMDSDFAASYMGGDDSDYDVIKDYQDVANGSIDAWNTMMGMANAGLADNESYQAIQGNNPDGSYNPSLEGWVDVANLTDYMLVNFYGGNTDWDHHNWAAMRNRADPGKGFRFFCWDSEHILKSLSENVIGENNPDCPSRVFQALRANEAYRVFFGDRVHELCFNGGPLTPEAVLARWNVRTGQVEPVIPAEAARWGDYRRDVHQHQPDGPFDVYTYEDYWIPERNFLVDEYFPNRTLNLIAQLRSAGLYPMLDAPEFFVDGEAWPAGGITRGAPLAMTSSEGVVYYTLDGTDPAVWGFESGLQEVLVEEDHTKYVHVPDGATGNEWRTGTDFDHSGWEVCSGAPGGIGYEEETGYVDLITLDVGDRMSGGTGDPNTSCLVRVLFELEPGDAERFASLLLKMQYDDGFAAFLNGVRVAEANAPFELEWNSAAGDTHEALAPEVFDLSAHLDLLREGTNLLAIQGLNRNTTSSDFLVSLSLTASEEVTSAISKQAALYSEPVPLDHSVRVVARTYHEGSWSAAMKGIVSFEDDLEDLRITEIHYHPEASEFAGSQDLEFVELKNIGTATLELGGVAFSEGIDFTFPSLAMAPGSFAVLASDDSAFYARYGFAPDGQYGGNLNNGGEFLLLQAPGGDTLSRFLYDNAWPWPVEADGLGYSLVPVEFDPPAIQSGPQNWRLSHEIGGSPGRDDTGPNSLPPDPQAEIQGMHLAQNYPNPFDGETYISFSLGKAARVELSVYNLMGQKVAQLAAGSFGSGTHLVSWPGTTDNGIQAAGGIYIYRIVVVDEHGTHTASRKMILY